MSETTDYGSDRSQPGWQPSPGSTSHSQPGHSLIGPTVVIRGEVTAEEDLLVKGRIEGFINHSQTVTIHADGTAAAEVKAREVLVEGTVDGNVYGMERVQIAETGQVNGNVYSPRVGVLEGASFKGAIDMDADVEAIERRFHEQTGTEPKKAPESEQVKNTSSKKEAAGKEQGEANAAQEEKEGSSSEAGSAATGSGAD